VSTEYLLCDVHRVRTVCMCEHSVLTVSKRNVSTPWHSSNLHVKTHAYTRGLCPRKRGKSTWLANLAAHEPKSIKNESCPFLGVSCPPLGKCGSNHVNMASKPAALQKQFCILIRKSLQNFSLRGVDIPSRLTSSPRKKCRMRKRCCDTHTHTRTHTHIHSHTYTHIHTHTHAPVNLDGRSCSTLAGCFSGMCGTLTFVTSITKNGRYGFCAVTLLL
jgi:hypothetical protein